MNVDLNINSTYKPYVGSYKNRVEVYYGGAGSGKSVFIAQKIILKALKGKRKILVVRKVQRTLRESCFSLIKSILSDIGILKRCKVNETNLTIKLPNGSFFLCSGIDDPEKIKSITDITDIWIEEATELNFNDYTQLDLRLRANSPNLQIILSFNPISKANWCYLNFFKENKNNAFILHTTYKDNKFLPDSYIETLNNMKKTNYAYYCIYALGKFASLDKRVYTNVEFIDFDINELIKEKRFITIAGLDFGFVNDTTAFIVALVDINNKELYVIDEYGDTGLVNEEIANIIVAKGYGKNIIIADSAEKKSIEEIKRAGVRKIKACEKGQDSINYGIQKLQNYKIYVPSKCPKTKTEFENYTWQKDKNTNEYINKPIDTFNHFMDALRYAIQIVDKRKGMGQIDKTLFGL